MDLLFTLCTWHAFAKLRLHTETTLDHFEATTTSLGQLLRRFLNVTCNAFDTRETPSEEAARGRRKAAMAAKGLASAKSKAKAAEGTHPQSQKLKPKPKLLGIQFKLKLLNRHENVPSSACVHISFMRLEITAIQ
jgi:hypothetical protein